MRFFFLAVAGLATTALVCAKTPEPSYTLSLPGGVSTKATLGVRYSPDGELLAATVTVARPGSPKRDQSRVTAEDLARAPGVLTPLKVFVTETWEVGANPLDVGESRKVVLTGFTKTGENVALERLADDRRSGNRNYSLDGPVSHWKLVTDGKRLVSLRGDHGVSIQRDEP